MTYQLLDQSPENSSPHPDHLRYHEQQEYASPTVLLGGKAVEISFASGMIGLEAGESKHKGVTDMSDTIATTSSPEGMHNAESYKQAYDAVMQAIDAVFSGESADLGDKLATVLHDLDVLSATSYISSAPEFVSLVQSARHDIEQARDGVESANGQDMNLDLSEVLTAAKKKLAETTVAYRPQ